jgi:hypothetical protein
MTHFPYVRAPDLTVTLSCIAVQYLTLIFHQHTQAKDVITSKYSVLRRILQLKREEVRGARYEVLTAVLSRVQIFWLLSYVSSIHPAKTACSVSAVLRAALYIRLTVYSVRNVGI